MSIYEGIPNKGILNIAVYIKTLKIAKQKALTQLQTKKIFIGLENPFLK